jgi:hypothetical protein
MQGVPLGYISYEIQTLKKVQPPGERGTFEMIQGTELFRNFDYKTRIYPKVSGLSR